MLSRRRYKMLSPLASKQNNKGLLSENDSTLIKHLFIKNYGYQYWKEVSLKELFELLPELLKDYNNQEMLRIATLKFYGVKNVK